MQQKPFVIPTISTSNSPKRILILVSSDVTKNDKFVELIEGNLKSENTKIELGFLYDVSFLFGEDQLIVRLKDKNITEYDLIYMRKVGMENTVLASTLGICLEYLGVPFYDSVFGKYGAKGNKIRSLIQLFVSGVSIPKTIYFWGVKGNYDYLVKNLGLSFIAKDIGLQRGQGIFLINNEEDFAKLPRSEGSHGKSVYLFQKLIEKDHEYRMLVLKDKVGVWEEKIATMEGEFRNNVALGAEEVFLKVEDMPKDMYELAVKTAKSLSIEIAGVDIITEKKTGKLFVLEGNRGPGLTYDETVSYEFKALAEFFEREVGEK